MTCCITCVKRICARACDAAHRGVSAPTIRAASAARGAVRWSAHCRQRECARLPVTWVRTRPPYGRHWRGSALLIAHDGDVAFPEHRSPRCSVGESDPRSTCPSARSCMSLSRGQGDAAGGQRDLHQRRAVEAEAGLAAPQIGHAEEALGDRDEIASRGVSSGARWRAGTIAAGGGDRERLLDARDGEPRAERQRLDRRKLDRGPGKHQRAQRRDLVGRRRRRRARSASAGSQPT